MSSAGTSEWLYLSVSDSGPGYADEVLEILNTTADCRTSSGRRIGLYNLKKRISYFYHGEAAISFSNLDTGGALTEIRIPAKYALPENTCENEPLRKGEKE